MRMRLFLVGIFFLVAFSDEAVCAGGISCDSEEILQIVKSLEASSWLPKEFIARFEQLAECPREAVSYLIEELHVVPEQVIRPGEGAVHAETMQVIWCIRALRYLTNGMDFTGKTAQFDEYNEKLGGLPTGKENDELYFFSVWMSRDILYIAPEDAQANIIKKWRQWYANNGEDFVYKSTEDFDEWYF